MTSLPPAPAAANVLAAFSTLSINAEQHPDASLPVSPLSIDEKLAQFALIADVPEFDDATKRQLTEVLDSKVHPVAFDGFEPSGRVTLAEGLLRALNARRLMQAGCRVRLWIADVHAMLNNKFGGDLKKLHAVSMYMVEVWKALGLDPSQQPNLEILLASTEIAHHADEYWSRMLDVAGRFTVERVQQCVPIMGRSVDDPVGNTNRIVYPLLQVADGFFLDVDIYQLGKDQDSAFELAQEYKEMKEDLKSKTSVLLSHPLLLGLKQEQLKMSTTDADSAIYMDDTAQEVNTKIKKAYCPPGAVAGNPILQYMKSIVFPMQGAEGVVLERSEKNGGNLSFATYAELEAAYSNEDVHPADLKPCLSKYLNLFLEPVRKHFAGGDLKKLATNVKKLKVSPKPDGDKLVNLAIPSYVDTGVREWRASELSPEERYTVARSVGEECIQDSELQTLLAKKEHFVCYDGFEPSGRMHIAQGVLRTVNVNKLTSAGGVFRFWVADWFAMLNNKMGGDLYKIQTVGKYMVEIWKSAGMDMTNVEFLRASDEILRTGVAYWFRVMDIARRTTLARTVKCCTIMGRKEKEGMPAAQIIYPLMQCSDIFFLQADVCQLGLDQRKINMLARDYCDLIKLKFKPVVLSHHMLMGLKQGQEKMSKSDPESAIFMEDSVEDVERKVAKAYCPEGTVEANPILDYMKHIIFPRFVSQGVDVQVVSGEQQHFETYEAMEAQYVAKQITGDALQASLTKYLNEILEPVRQHFATGEGQALLEQVRSFRITR